MSRVPIPSQTVGPFFHLGCTDDHSVASLAGPNAKGQPIRVICRVLDGDGVPVDDAMIELWQANAEGKYHHPADTQAKAIDPAFHGFGRLATDGNGSCSFTTIMPGGVPAEGSGLQAPHINVSVFARGILRRLATRIYFENNPANRTDPVLALVPERRRSTLMAQRCPQPGEWRFEIRLSGENETVFFDV